MKKHKVAIVLFALLIAGTLIGCTKQTEQENVQSDNKIRTFADWTQFEAFQEVPAMAGDHFQVGQILDAGDSNYLIDINGSSLEDYRAYLALLEEAGFKKYVDNGEGGIDESVYSAMYTKNELVVTVCHVVKIDKTYISASKKLALSEHLIYDEKFVADNIDGAQTTLHMRELYDFGNSFIIQLKNGHFILNDGGVDQDAEYLVEYLESLVPEGETPVIEAWFISHPHADHAEIFKGFIRDLKLAKRLIVEGIYFNQPSNDTINNLDPNSLVYTQYIDQVPMAFKTLEGTKPESYRPQLGQRYYFCDITIDVIESQEMLIFENSISDINETSTWLMYNIEGQKFLLAGDADQGSQEIAMRTYDSDYFDLDVFAVFHHGINVYNFWTDYCTLKTVLYTSNKCESSFANVEGSPYARVQENKYLQESCAEYMSWGDGTKVLTFPYKVGTAKTLPMETWEYHPERGQKEK